MSTTTAADKAREFGIDPTIIYENLKLSPTERIEKLERLLEFIHELKRARDSKINAGNEKNH